jgi:glycine cleavage system protein P-like pyridoxal-binding family
VGVWTIEVDDAPPADEKRDFRTPIEALHAWGGFAALARDAEQRLCAMAGYDALSLQPNSDAQAEFAGPPGDLSHSPSAHGTFPPLRTWQAWRLRRLSVTHGKIDLADLTVMITLSVHALRFRRRYSHR